MNRQTALQAKETGLLRKNRSSWLNHAAVRPVAEAEMLPGSATGGLTVDLTSVPVRPQAQATGQTASRSCPMSPQRCPFGGACHSCPPRVQAKLKIGQPGDKYEQEADRVAEQVMRMPEPTVQRKGCSSCKGKEEDEDKILQAKPAGNVGNASAQVDHPLIQNVLSSPGQPLDAGTRSFMEPRFGQDFSGVWVQRDDMSATEKEPSDDEKYKAALKKIGEAFLETAAGKELKAKAEALGKDFVSSVEGKVIVVTALGGALSALISTNEELPVPIPEIPLDFIALGLKAKVKWEGPVRTPTNVSLTITTGSGVSLDASYSKSEATSGKAAEQKAGLTLTIPLGGESTKAAKPTVSESEKYRAETTGIAADQAKFREGLKSPEQRAIEDRAFWNAYWRMQMNDPLNPLMLGRPRRSRPKETGEQKKEEETLVRKATHSAVESGEVPLLVHDVLSSLGQPLDAGTRSFMEPRFGQDFSGVRVHTDGKAAESARAVNARAYTVGRDVVFGEGQYVPGSGEGRRLVAHELAHVGQQGGANSFETNGRISQLFYFEQDKKATNIEPTLLQRQPAQQILRNLTCYRPGAALPQGRPDDCDTREPENCATYEQWLNSFQRLTVSTARDTAPGGTSETGFEVLGDRATRPVDNISAPTQEQPAPVVSPQVADQFIDHPTDQWVTTCLPSNLRETAYRLPADCADIAVILRHVWLAAHHRTESYGGWAIGDRAGGAQQRHIAEVIGSVYSGNVARMVNAYSDSSGQPLQTFDSLQDLLHPGDMLVWEHHSGGLGTARTGGHTQTIVHLTRNSGRVTMINVVQGNQPIFQPQAQEIRNYVGGRSPSEGVLRDAPGRRIETSSLSGSDLQDIDIPTHQGHIVPSPRPKIWTWDDGHTTLVAAGPPAAAPRPTMHRVDDQVIRRISDWFSSLRNATSERLHGIFEAALLELRAMVEGGQTGLDSDAAQLGQTAGERLWNLARQAGQSRTGDLADESHFRPLQQIRAMIQALGNPAGQHQFSSAPNSSAGAVQRLFNLIDAAFHLAARGASTIDFIRRIPRGWTLVKVLVTGFDPFVSIGRVPPGEVNPSGAAALAMDNTEVREGRVSAAVEGVVLPVSFDDFRSGMVENIVRPLVRNREVDAILTVSLDASIAPTDPVRIERFVIGVHEEGNRLGAIPSASSAGIGPAIIETPSPVEDIARETEQPVRRSSSAIPQAAIGTAIDFRFPTATIANRAMTILGLSPSGNREVSINDVPALQQIIRTMRRSPNGLDIMFRVGGETFQATVLSGPGGNFLSNEVSFRVLRLLGEEHRQDISSFHVHVQRPLPGMGDRIPQDMAATRADRTARTQAISFAIGVRNRLIATLRNMVRAVAMRIAARSNPSQSQTP